MENLFLGKPYVSENTSYKQVSLGGKKGDWVLTLGGIVDDTVKEIASLKCAVIASYYSYRKTDFSVLGSKAKAITSFIDIFLII